MEDLVKIIVDYFKGKNLPIESIADEIDKAKKEVLESFIKDDEVYLQKRSGNIEAYKDSKIERSIINAARNKQIQISSSDISILIDDIERKIEGYKGKILPTKRLKEIVEEVLEKDGYNKVLDSYKSYIK